MYKGEENFEQHEYAAVAFDWRAHLRSPELISAENKKTLDMLSAHINAKATEDAIEFLEALSGEGKYVLGTDKLSALVQHFRHKKVPELELSEEKAQELLKDISSAGVKLVF